MADNNNIHHHHHHPTQPSSLPDSEEFSSFFNHLLHHSPSSMDPNHPSSPSSFPFSDPYDYDSNPYLSCPDSSFNHDFPPSHLQENGEASELPSSKAAPPPPTRTSSKRSRAAEFHNLSEKRRRSRINEKMKALQNLIPNSNKTDKASMLDEAIEYLKQLQLQVQMLMMRNGLSLHPMSLPGGLRPMILPQTGLNVDEPNNGFQNSNTSAISLTANDEDLARPSYSFPKQCSSISNQSLVIPSVTNIAATSNSSSTFQPSLKDPLYSNMSQLFLDTTKIGKNPSPDVS